MRKKNCPACAKKIAKTYNFCPHCGESFKARSEHENYGFLGRDDAIDFAKTQNEVRLPFGLNKIVNSLVKQLEKQMSEMNIEEETNGKIPNGFKIKISTGQNGTQMLEEQQKPIQKKEHLPEAEIRRRNKLPKEEAETNIRRLSDRIIYEIQTPGVQGKKNITLNELANGIEIRAYSKNKCYIKHIPIQVEVLNYYLENEKLYVECKA